MSEDLVNRLRRYPYDFTAEAAGRIEALEAALLHIYAWYPISVTQPRQTIDEMRDYARAALEGEKKDG